MPRARKPVGYEPITITPERKAIYAVVSDRGDATGPLTQEQADGELTRLQAASDDAHGERLGERGIVAHRGMGEPLPPPHYDVVELDHDARFVHADRKRRPKAERGLGTEEVGK